MNNPGFRSGSPNLIPSEGGLSMDFGKASYDIAKNNKTNIGNLPNLQTSNKGSIVEAINELKTGGSGGDKTYTFTQLSPTPTWIVPHNLNKFPAVTIIDTDGDIVIGDVQFVSLNELTISFTIPVAGKVYIN